MPHRNGQYHFFFQINCPRKVCGVASGIENLHLYGGRVFGEKVQFAQIVHGVWVKSSMEFFTSNFQ